MTLVLLYCCEYNYCLANKSCPRLSLTNSQQKDILVVAVEFRVILGNDATQHYQHSEHTRINHVQHNSLDLQEQPK